MGSPGGLLRPATPSAAPDRGPPAASCWPGDRPRGRRERVLRAGWERAARRGRTDGGARAQGAAGQQKPRRVSWTERKGKTSGERLQGSGQEAEPGKGALKREEPRPLTPGPTPEPRPPAPGQAAAAAAASEGNWLEALRGGGLLRGQSARAVAHLRLQFSPEERPAPSFLLLAAPPLSPQRQQGQAAGRGPPMGTGRKARVPARGRGSPKGRLRRRLPSLGEKGLPVGVHRETAPGASRARTRAK